MSLPDADPADSVDPRWRGVLRTAALAAWASVGLIVVQVAVFAAWPPPDDVPGIFALMVHRPVLGLVSLDALYIVNNVLVALMYLALAATLGRRSPSLVVIALTLGLLQMAAYLGSNPAFELLDLAHRHAAAPDPARAGQLVAAGEGVLAAWRGTAFLVYYELGAVVLLVFALAMRRSGLYSRATLGWLIAAGVLMLVPSPAPVIGLGFALASLVPWSALCILLGRRWFALARRAGAGANERASRNDH